MSQEHKNASLEPAVAESIEQTAEDFKNAGLVVSVLVNLFVFSAWLVLEVTDAYNAQIISYLQK